MTTALKFAAQLFVFTFLVSSTIFLVTGAAWCINWLAGEL